jgi:hypothetical protein
MTASFRPAKRGKPVCSCIIKMPDKLYTINHIATDNDSLCSETLKWMVLTYRHCQQLRSLTGW